MCPEFRQNSRSLGCGSKNYQLNDRDERECEYKKLEYTLKKIHVVILKIQVVILKIRMEQLDICIAETTSNTKIGRCFRHLINFFKSRMPSKRKRFDK